MSNNKPNYLYGNKFIFTSQDEVPTAVLKPGQGQTLELKGTVNISNENSLNPANIMINGNRLTVDNVNLDVEDLDNFEGTPINNDVLIYNASEQKWKSSQISSVTQSVTSLNALSDVQLNSISENQYIKWTSNSKWENVNLTLNNSLDDVISDNPQNSEILYYTQGAWTNGLIPVQTMALSLLQDTSIVDLQDTQGLVYNNVSGKFENAYLVNNVQDLDNVDITGIVDNSILYYTNNMFKPMDINFVTSIPWQTMALSSLQDTSIVDLQDTQGLVFNNVSGKWENTYLVNNIQDLDNVDITGIADNSILYYTNNIFKSIPINFLTSITPQTQSISSLEDTLITDIQHNNYLSYSTITGKWENVTLFIPTSIEDLSDVGENPGVFATNQYMKWNGLQWEAGDVDLNASTQTFKAPVNVPSLPSLVGGLIIPLVFNGTEYVVQQMKLSDLGDISPNTSETSLTASAGDILIATTQATGGINFKAVTPDFINMSSVTNYINTINPLTNTIISSVNSGDIIVYTNGFFRNYPLSISPITNYVPDNINALTNTILNTIAVNDILVYTNGSFRNVNRLETIFLYNMQDCTIPQPVSENSILCFTQGSWRSINRLDTFFLKDMSDVNIPSPSENDVLVYTRTGGGASPLIWKNVPRDNTLYISNMNDVTLSAITMNQILMTTSNGLFINRTPQLNFNSDVSLNSLTNNDIFYYTNSKWANKQISFLTAISAQTQSLAGLTDVTFTTSYLTYGTSLYYDPLVSDWKNTNQDALISTLSAVTLDHINRFWGLNIKYATSVFGSTTCGPIFASIWWIGNNNDNIFPYHNMNVQYNGLSTDFEAGAGTLYSNLATTNITTTPTYYNKKVSFNVDIVPQYLHSTYQNGFPVPTTLITYNYSTQGSLNFTTFSGIYGKHQEIFFANGISNISGIEKIAMSPSLTPQYNISDIRTYLKFNGTSGYFSNNEVMWEPLKDIYITNIQQGIKLYNIYFYDITGAIIPNSNFTASGADLNSSYAIDNDLTTYCIIDNTADNINYRKGLTITPISDNIVVSKIQIFQEYEKIYPFNIVINGNKYAMKSPKEKINTWDITYSGTSFKAPWTGFYTFKINIGYNTYSYSTFSLIKHSNTNYKKSIERLGTFTLPSYVNKIHLEKDEYIGILLDDTDSTGQLSALGHTVHVYADRNGNETYLSDNINENSTPDDLIDKIAWSEDIIFCTNYSTNKSLYLCQETYGPTIVYNTYQEPQIHVTTDGISFFTVVPNSNRVIEQFRYYNNMFYAVAHSISGTTTAGAEIMISPNAITWERYALTGAYNPCDLVVGDDKVVILNRKALSGAEPTIIYGTPGNFSWTTLQISTMVGWRSMDYNKQLGTYVAISDGSQLNGNRCMYSKDAITWTTIGTSTWGDVLNRVKYFNYPLEKFFVVGLNFICRSSDGISWVSSPSPENKSFNDITYNAQQDIITMSSYLSEKIWISSDQGLTFSKYTSISHQAKISSLSYNPYYKRYYAASCDFTTNTRPVYKSENFQTAVQNYSNIINNDISDLNIKGPNITIGSKSSTITIGNEDTVIKINGELAYPSIYFSGYIRPGFSDSSYSGPAVFDQQISSSNVYIYATTSGGIPITDYGCMCIAPGTSFGANPYAGRYTCYSPGYYYISISDFITAIGAGDSTVAIYLCTDFPQTLTVTDYVLRILGSASSHNATYFSGISGSCVVYLHYNQSIWVRIASPGCYVSSPTHGLLNIFKIS